MEFALTLIRRRGEEAVLRDANGNRWVLPAGTLGASEGVTVNVERVVPIAKPTDPVFAARNFLSHILGGA